MSAETVQITEVSRSAYQDAPVPAPAASSMFMKWCEDCEAHYLHNRESNYTECIVCGKKTYAIRRTQTNRVGG